MASNGINIQEGELQIQEIIEEYRKRIVQIRTGVATLDMIKDISVSVYGQNQPLEYVSTITISSARSLTVKPFDASNLNALGDTIKKQRPDYELAIKNNMVYINLPMLTEDSRKEYVKLLKEKTEQTRQKIRDVRHKIRDFFNAEKDKMPENDYYKKLEEVDKLVAKYNEDLEKLYTKKSEELMKV